MTTAKLLTEATDSDLAAAVEENLFALFRAMAALPGSDIVEAERLSHHFASPHNPMFKGVWKCRLSSPELDKAIDDVTAWFRARRAPFFFWWTGQETQPPDLGERLIVRGFEAFGMEGPGMAADLRQMAETTLLEVPRGLTIEEVRDEAALLDFERVIVEGFGIPEAMAHGWVEAARGFGIGRTPWQMYLARLGGEPVATHILFKGAGVAGVYGVATVPAARRKGIGGAITLQPLLTARDEGYRYAVLWSSEAGIRAYDRIGFHAVPTMIDRYIWRSA